MPGPTRRGMIAGALASLAAPPMLAAATDERRLYRDVLRYESFGDHRSGSRGDALTMRWISDRLRRLGFSVALQPFPIDLFEPHIGRLAAGSAAFDTFPLWPPRETPPRGLRAPLVHSRPAGPNEIALLRLPYAPNASISAPAYRDPILRAIESRPAALVCATEGPTGAIIALNVPDGAPRWPMPIALIGGRDGDRLISGAGNAPLVTLVQRGRRRSSTAHNVTARRRGQGRTLVVSTPISGWFTCAGERGAGIALFLALAEQLAASTTRPLLFLATSGHEFEGMGSRAAMAELPRPSEVGAWIHIGANVAGAAVDLADGSVRTTGRAFGPRGVGATAALIGPVRDTYRGLAPYAPPVLLDRANAVGDVGHYLEAGYGAVMALVGAHPIHHTRLDRAANATSPELLDQAFRPLLRAVSLIDRSAP